MRAYLFFIVVFFYGLGHQYSHADTLIVSSHKHVDMVWHENYDRMAYFPTKGKQFRKIFMIYTLSCASGGCSDWDYDVNTYIMHKTGQMDSTIASFDTISTNPLLIDTIWNKFDQREAFELGRFITPYGTYMNFRNQSYGTAGFDSSWRHSFVYDVTDYRFMLEDSVMIRSQYNGWSSGFGASIQFVFIEGIPQRDVLKITNVYEKGGGYQSTAQFESQITPAVKVAVPDGAVQAQVKVIITGHGANQAEACAEFCDKDYFLKVNGVERFRSRMWRDDCDRVVVSPQGGTWIFPRGNWCPGDKVYERRHEITEYLSGDSIELDMDIEPYVVSGSGSASHSLSSTIFFYGRNNYKLDAELHSIIAPNNFSEYARYNPACGQTILVIKNNAHTQLNYAKIEYGAEGGPMTPYEWHGDLGFEEMDTLYLGPPLWTGTDTLQRRFEARIFNQNHKKQDDMPDNDRLTSNLELVPRLEPFRLLFRTNGVPEENRLSITNEKGEVVLLLEQLQPYTLYQENLDLPAGCYQLFLEDEGGDGLDFWYYGAINPPYSEGRGGYLRLIRQGGGSYINFGGDFGAEVRYNFVVGQMNIPESPILPPVGFSIFPNPGNGRFYMEIPEAEEGFASAEIINNFGQKVKTIDHIPVGFSYWYELVLNDLQNGMYIVRFVLGEQTFTERIVISNK